MLSGPLLWPGRQASYDHSVGIALPRQPGDRKSHDLIGIARDRLFGQPNSVRRRDQNAGSLTAKVCTNSQAPFAVRDAGILMMHIYHTVITLSCLISISGCCQQATPAPTRHFEPSANFSYLPPAGWTIKDTDPPNTGIVVSEPVDGFSANVLFTFEARQIFPITLPNYVKLLRDSFKTMFPDLTVIKDDRFQTKSGLQGFVHVIQRKEDGVAIQQTFYFLENGPAKLIVGCTSRTIEADKFSPMFEELLESLRFEK